MIGDKVPPSQQQPDFLRLLCETDMQHIARTFSIAGELSTQAQPLLNFGSTLDIVRDTGDGQARDPFLQFTTLSMERHEIFLGIGDNLFVQVPVLLLASDIDVCLSGTIDGEGNEARLDKTTLLSTYLQQQHNLSLENVPRVFAVALLPKDVLGDNLFIGMRASDPSNPFFANKNNALKDSKIDANLRHLVSKLGSYGLDNSRPAWMMAANGFIDRGLIGTHEKLTRLLIKSGDKQRYLKTSDVLSVAEIQELEEQGIFPSLTLVMAQFSEQTYKIRMPRISSGQNMKYGNIDLNVTRGGAGGTLESTGQVGMEVGRETEAARGTIQGHFTKVDALLSLKFLVVESEDGLAEVKSKLTSLKSSVGL